MDICEAIGTTIGRLFTCTPQGRYVRVRTPFMYPDGDVIDLFVAGPGDGGTFTISDLGETLRWLRMQTTSPKRSPKQERMIQDVCLTQNVELYRGMLMTRATWSDLSLNLVKVAQAAVRVSDIWFTLRTRAVESVTDEVADFLTERGIGYERSQRIQGRSGRTWTVDFHTRTAERSSLTCVLSSGSRASARGVVEHVVTTWHDLSHVKLGALGLEFISLFDDTVDVWIPEDFRLLEPLSKVAGWSRPDEFETFLRAA